MSVIRINWHPGPRELRSFGWVMLVAFGLIGLVKLAWPFAWGFSRNPAVGGVCLAVAVVAGGLGIAGTKAALPFYWAWMGLAYVLGNVMSRVLFGIFFFGLVTPMALLMRLVGRDKLMLNKPDASTYWRDAPPPDAPERYERQF